ncbi:hypothetical protein FRC05_010924 [Tulasnella sp. 425]|nr:hypothetical protein FRC05_010924 [Tulasnella sp. 425]
MPHEDGPSYFPAVGTISLGSYTVVDYYRYRPLDEEDSKVDDPDIDVSAGANQRGRAIDPVPVLCVLLEPRSLVVTTKELYTEFLHGISERTQDMFCPHEDISGPETTEGTRIANYRMLRNNDIKKCIAEGGVLERQDRISLTCRDYENVRTINTERGTTTQANPKVRLCPPGHSVLTRRIWSSKHWPKQSPMEDVESKEVALLGPPTMELPPNSIMWIKMIRSHFLLIQSSGAILAPWDLTAPLTCVATCNLDGTVDGAVIEEEEDPRMMRILLSTRSCTTYKLRLDIPDSNESQAPLRLTPSIVFGGLCQILDARGPLFALSRLEGRGPGAFIKDQRGSAVVELASLPPGALLDPPLSNHGGQNSRLQIAHNGVIDIQIFDDVIVVARNCNIDLYNLLEVAERSFNGAESGGVSTVQPLRYLNYPNLERPVYRGSLLRHPNPRLGISPGSLALFSAEYPSCYRIISWPEWRQGTAAPSEITYLEGLVKVAGCMFNTALGPSGHRFALSEDENLSIYFTSRRDSDSTTGPQSSEGRMAGWMIAGALGDIPVALDFDEVTGRCVFAMASGRMWVKETTNFSSEPRAFNSLKKLLPDFEVIEIPNPDPARWPVVIPFRTPYNFGNPPASDPPKEVAPRWSDEVDKYFPYKNRPDCYGSTPWLIHEALHIPVVWPGHHPPSVGEYGARTVLFTVEAAEPDSPFYDEVIEVRPLPGSDERSGFWALVMDCGNWEFYRLRPVGGLDDIVAHLQHDGIGKLFENDEPWPADEVKLGQLSRWRYRHNRRFGQLISERNLT